MGAAQTVAAAVIIVGKFGLPLLIIRFPFAAAWANFALDSVDGDLLIPLGVPDPIYQTVDKTADWATYIGMVLAAYRAGWPIRRLVLGLFLFRSIGQAAFLVTHEELYLAAFPNFLEPLFLTTASILAYKRAVRHLPDWRERGFAVLMRHRWLIGSLVVVYKLQDEYFTHVANLDRSDFVRGLLGL